MLDFRYRLPFSRPIAGLSSFEKNIAGFLRLVSVSEGEIFSKKEKTLSRVKKVAGKRRVEQCAKGTGGT